MPPRKNTTVRRQEILAAALTIIGAKGVSGLTISETASRAGMSDANIYRHFKGGKQELLLALGEFIGQRVMGRAAALAAGPGSPLAKLREIYRAHVALVAANPGLPRFMFSEEVHLGDRRLGQAMAGRMAEYIAILAGLLAEGVESGALRSGLSPRETAVTLLGMIQFTALRWSVSRAGFAMEEEGARLWENFEGLVKISHGTDLRG